MEASPYLKVGDRVSFFFERDSVKGYIAGNGFADDNVYLSGVAPGHEVIPNFQDAVFEVHIFKTLASLSAYFTALDKHKTHSKTNLTRSIESIAGDDIVELKKKYEAEVAYNESLQERSLGQYVCYGHIIELRHAKSQKYLCIDPSIPAETNPEALEISLGDLTERWFKIMPRYKLHTEGQRVHVNDQVVLLNLRTHHSVHFEMPLQPDDAGNQFDLNATLHMADGFQVKPYFPVAPAELNDENLNGGETIRFYNKENDGLIAIEKVGKMPKVIPHMTSRRGLTSSNTLFMLEHADASNGSFLTWKDKLRLKHVGSGLYLKVTTENSKLHKEPIGRPRSVALNISDAEGLSELYQLDMTADHDDNESLFMVEPVYKEDAEGYVRINSTFRLWSVGAEAYVSVTDTVIAEAQEVEQNDDDDFVSEMVGAANAPTAARLSRRLKLRMSKRPFDEDTMVFVLTNEDEMWNLNEIRAAKPVLEEYVQLIAEGKRVEPRPRDLIHRTCATLRKLIIFIQDVSSDRRNMSPFDLDETPIAARQLVLKEQGILDLVVAILETMFKKNSKGGHFIEIKGILDPKNKVYYELAKLCYRLLRQAIKDCDECRLYLSTSDHVNLMQVHLGYQLKTAYTLMELFRDNKFLLERLTQGNINVFIDLMQNTGKYSRYMTFINALIVCDDAGLPNNQKRVCEMLLIDNFDTCLIRTRVRDGTILVDMESVKIYSEQQPNTNSWVTMAEFAEANVGESVEYFEQMLLCFAFLCLGRNRTCVDLISRLFPYQACYAIATDSQASDRLYGIRGALLRIIQTVYVDADPHDRVACMNLTRNWQGFEADIPKTEHLDRIGFAPIVDDTLGHEASKRSRIGETDSSLSKYMKPRPATTTSKEKNVELAPLLGASQSSRQSSEQQKMFEGVDFTELKKYLIQKVRNSRYQVIEHREKNEMLLACLSVLAELIRHGFFISLGELELMIEPLIECLDGRNDILIETNQEEEDAAATIGSTLSRSSMSQIQFKRHNRAMLLSDKDWRFRKNPDNLVVMRCKQKIIEIFDILTDLRSDFRLSLLLKIFEEKVNRNEYNNLREVLQRHEDEMSRRRSLTQGQRRILTAGDALTSVTSNIAGGIAGGLTGIAGGLGTVANVLGIGSGDANPFEDVFRQLQWKCSRSSLVEVLLDCTLYDHKPLVSAGFAMLIRNFSQRLLLLEALQDTQILCSKESQTSYKTAHQNYRLIVSLMGPRMSSQDDQEVVKALEILEKMCITVDGAPNLTNQQILRSLGVHNLANRLLRLPFSNKLPQEQSRRDVFLKCYTFLKNFATKNSANQNLLLPFVPFYMTQMGAKLKAADTVSEIFRDNRQVCSQIEEDTIRHFAKIISDRGRFPRHIRFLQIIVRPEGRPLARNQNLVLAALLEKGPKCIILYNDAEGKEERARLIREQDHLKNEEGDINYHIALIQLLKYLAEGENETSQSKIRDQLSLEYCIGHIKDNAPLFIKTAFIDFVSEHYARKSASQDLNELWQFCDALIPVIQECSREPSSPHTSNAILTISAYLDHMFTTALSTYKELQRDSLITIAKEYGAAATAILKVSSHKSIITAVNHTTKLILEAKVSSSIKPDFFPQIRAGANVDETEAIGESSTAQIAQIVLQDAGSKDAKVKGALTAFTKEYRIQLGLLEDGGYNSPEFLELIDIFKDDDPFKTASLHEDPANWTVANWSAGNVNTIKLMNHIVNLKGGDSLKKTCLNILEHLAEFEDLTVEPPITLEMSQNRLDRIGEFSDHKLREKSFGAMRVALKMMVDPVHQGVLEEVLEVAIALLENGNAHCQKRAFNFLRGEHGTIFFESIRDLIRLGAVEIKDLIAHHKRVEEIRAALAGADEQVIQNALPIFSERAQMKDLLRFLQLLCEGHNRNLQNILRTQDARRSYDIVTEVAEYVTTLYNSEINGVTVQYAIQALQTLTEFMQGPCKGNQEILASSKLPGTCNKIMQTDRPSGCSIEDLANLQEETVLCMAALMEGCIDAVVPRGLFNEFNFENLYRILIEAHTSYTHAEDKTESDVQEKLETAFYIYTFILYIKDFVPEVREGMILSLEPHGVLDFFETRTGHVEVTQDDLLMRVYFRLPLISQKLTDAAKEEVLWAVDRSSATQKLDDFLVQAEDLEADMLHQQQIAQTRGVNILVAEITTKLVKWFALFFACLSNALMLGSYESPADVEVRDVDRDPKFAAIYFFSWLLAVLEWTRFVQFLLMKARLIVRKGFTQRPEWMHQFAKHNRDPKRIHIKYILLSIRFLLSDHQFALEVALLVVSVCGIVISPLFFSIHLAYYMIEFSQDLQNVLRAVTLNGKSLILTAVFGIVLVYLMAIWAFLSLGEFYKNGELGDLCSDLFQCTVVTLHSGLRKGDIGEVLESTEWGSGELIVFEFLYFVVILIIMLNVIFGIIIDTFGELRQIKSDTEDDIKNKCFICSIDRYTFDRLAEGFEFHIKKEHNMWEYLFFLVHLNQKDVNNYTGPESFVKACVDARDAKWFPVNKAVTLAEHHKREKQAQTQLQHSVETTQQQTRELLTNQSKMQTQLNIVEQALERMERLIRSIS